MNFSRIRLVLLAMFVPLLAGWIYTDTDGVIIIGVIADPNDPETFGWTPLQDAGSIEGNVDDPPNLLTVTCDKNWLHGVISTPTWDGDDWSVNVGIRGRDTGVSKDGTCTWKHDGTTLDTTDFEFDASL